MRTSYFAESGFELVVEIGGFVSRFLSSPFIIRVPFFLLFGFNKGTLK